MQPITVTDEIYAALDLDPRVPHPVEIAVFEQAGTVTLRGSVGSLRQRSAAVQIARSISGVHTVEDFLEVDWHDRFDDDEVRGAALQALMWDPDVQADRIDVTVRDGWLTLKGEVKHQHESDAAFEDVSRLPIGGITNEIKVITAGLP